MLGEAVGGVGDGYAFLCCCSAAAVKAFLIEDGGYFTQFRVLL